MPTTTHSTVFEALFAVQQNLPHVGKDNTADTGKYKYSYADLNAVQDALFPLFAEHGLVWSATPAIVDGKFVLSYQLVLTSPPPTDQFSGGARVIHGEYPLPSGAPQEIGSALTYARRYALCTVTGLAPGGDDDDGAAAQPKPPTMDDATVQEWVDTLNAAETIPALQAAWEAAGKAGAGKSSKVIAAKDARKKALA